MDVVDETITVGIVISHNKTFWCLQEKLAAVRNRINKEKIQELGVALTGREPTNDILQKKLCGDYQIDLVPGQSAISTDFHVTLEVNCLDNPFVRTLYRHNVWTSRCKLLNIILCPEPTIDRGKHGNWNFLCDVLRKQNWFTDVRQELAAATSNSFALCASTIASHKAFYDTCVKLFLEKWGNSHWSMSREQFYGQLCHWITAEEVTSPQQVSFTS